VLLCWAGMGLKAVESSPRMHKDGALFGVVRFSATVAWTTVLHQRRESIWRRTREVTGT
jgi:hypothetical protein